MFLGSWNRLPSTLFIPRKFVAPITSTNNTAPATGAGLSYNFLNNPAVRLWLPGRAGAAGKPCEASVGCSSMIQALPTLAVVAGVAFLVFWYGVRPNWKDDPEYDLVELDAQDDVFISSENLHDLMVNSSTGVTVLDARNKRNAFSSFAFPGSGDSIPGARHAPWGDFTISGGRGDLKPVAELESKFRELGVSNNVPVVVFGSWKEEWGEEGRIFWQLQWLGHPNVRILYGGIFGWTDSDRKGGTGIQGKGNFAADPKSELIIDADEIADRIDAGGDDLFLLDSRTKAEFEGSTQYNVERGGHIPGAVSFHWKEVFAEDGNLRNKTDLREQLEDLGLRDGMKVAAYCTGGIRSGFFYAVFRWLGYSNIANYPGSWWDWASRTDLPISTFTGHS